MRPGPGNPGYLKLELALRGVCLDSSVRGHRNLPRVVPPGPAGRSLDLILPEGVWVNVPVEERFTTASPFTLVAEGGRTVLVRHDGGLERERVEVQVVPQPAFYERRTSRGTPMWRVGMVYGNYIAIQPGGACGFSLRGVPCQFCRAGSRAARRPEPTVEVAEVVEVVRAAFDEGAADFVYFNTGFFDTADGGIAFLEPYIEAVRKHFDTLVATQLHPPRQDRWIDRTYAMGVDALSYNVEIYDPEVLARYCVGRVQHIGRERYYEALAYAARIFPSGTLWSDLIVGLEPPESTMRGIDALTALGVLPVLSIFRPLDGTPLANHPLPRLEDVAPVFGHLYTAVKRSRINMGWVRDLSLAVTPLDARFFAGEDARLVLAMQGFYRSRIGSFATRSLSRLRRRLRVRRVSQSFESSRL